MNTRCENCIFRINEENSSQIGCSLNIIEKMLSYKEIYSKDNIKNINGYYTLKNFYCPFAKTKEWMQHMMNNNPDIDLLKEAIMSAHQTYYMVLLVKDNNINNAIEIIDGLAQQELTPSMLSIIYIGDQQDSINSLLDLCKSSFATKKIIWKIHKIIDTSSTDSEAVDQCLETSLTENTNMVLILNADYTNSVDILYHIYDIVNFHLNKPLAILSPSPIVHNICIPYNLYAIFYKKIGLVLDYLHNIDNEGIKYYLT